MGVMAISQWVSARENQYTIAKNKCATQHNHLKRITNRSLRLTSKICLSVQKTINRSTQNISKSEKTMGTYYMGRTGHPHTYAHQYNIPPPSHHFYSNVMENTYKTI